MRALEWIIIVALLVVMFLVGLYCWPLLVVQLVSCTVYVTWRLLQMNEPGDKGDAGPLELPRD